MKRSISNLAIVSGIIIQASTMAQGFAMTKKRVDFTRILPIEMVEETLSYLSYGQIHEIHKSKDLNLVLFQSAEYFIQREVKKYVGEFILLPEVTNQEVLELRQALGTRNETSSIEAMPAFRIAKSKTSAGLYRAVMGYFPLHAPASQVIEWDANPNLPATYTTTDEDIEFAARLSQITGRHFRIISDSENEYSIRGRALMNGSPTGDIITHIYGFESFRVRNYAWIYSNSGYKAHSVTENPPGHSHSFGLNQVVGNVSSRSSDGVLRGSAFNDHEWYVQSSISLKGCALDRSASIGSRLVEDLI